MGDSSDPEELEFDGFFVKEESFKVDSAQFINIYAHQHVCLSQNFFDIAQDVKLCTSCCYDACHDVGINAEIVQVSRHITDYAVNLAEHNYLCYLCETPLFTYCLTRFCLMCA